MLLVKQVLLRMDLSEVCCRLLLMKWDFPKLYLISGLASDIGRLYTVYCDKTITQPLSFSSVSILIEFRVDTG